VRLALFGGTFDPIHDAHLALARRALERFQFERILFVPAAHPPHKSGITHASYADRVRMAELACAGEPRFEVSRLEENTARSYSILTVEKVRATLTPEDEIYFLIGADAFAEVTTWYRWREVARAVRFLVVSRPGCAYHAPEGVTLDHIDDVEMGVSSSAIREALAAGRLPEGLPPAVLAYAQAHRLYT
jgi:nicotinate-nucleotide adenylyltransferase